MDASASPLLDELRRVSDLLDALIGEMSSGRPSQPRHDAHVAECEAIATRIRRAARGPGRPSNPPLGRLGRGYIW